MKLENRQKHQHDVW